MIIRTIIRIIMMISYFEGRCDLDDILLADSDLDLQKICKLDDIHSKSWSV